MKTKKIDEILELMRRDSDPNVNGGLTDSEAKQQLLELFMSCVPEQDRGCGIESDYGEAWNDCRNQIIKNIEKLK